VTSVDAGNLAEVRTHWWWRPGWRAGRHFYACHLTLEDQPALRDLVRHHQDALADLGNLDLIPPRWLHLTMQGIGFVDNIGTADLTEITERITEQLRDAAPPTVTFHRPTVSPEAVYLRAHPAEPIYQLRLAVYQVVTAALGPGRFGESPPSLDQYKPHVSVAYINSDGPAQPIIDALSKANSPAAVTTTFRTASILTFHRDHQMYEWTDARPIPIGRSSAHLSDTGPVGAVTTFSTASRAERLTGCADLRRRCT
jgi:2'-5' RNA ligase